MYVSRIFGHVSRHEIHKALQFKDPLPRTPVKMYLLVSKSGLRHGLYPRQLLQLGGASSRDAKMEFAEQLVRMAHSTFPRVTRITSRWREIRA
jgi:hypothetical protein